MLTGDPVADVMVEEAIALAEEALIVTVNEMAERVYQLSQDTVPKAAEHKERPSDPTYPEQPLAESAYVKPAEPGDPRAEVIYDSPYAKPQEVGQMTYVNPKSGKEVEWVAEHYTTPGTGAHYLGNALKAVAGDSELLLQANVKLATEEGPGFAATRAKLSVPVR